MQTQSDKEFQAGLDIYSEEYHGRTPLPLHRPGRSADGTGGFHEILGDPLVTVQADPVVQSGKYSLTIPSSTDVRVGDVFIVARDLFREV
jgi:hypothetical protein